LTRANTTLPWVVFSTTRVIIPPFTTGKQRHHYIGPPCLAGQDKTSNCGRCVFCPSRTETIGGDTIPQNGDLEPGYMARLFLWLRGGSYRPWIPAWQFRADSRSTHSERRRVLRQWETTCARRLEMLSSFSSRLRSPFPAIRFGSWRAAFNTA
jgi:hypothetical protein